MLASIPSQKKRKMLEEDMKKEEIAHDVGAGSSGVSDEKKVLKKREGGSKKVKQEKKDADDDDEEYDVGADNGNATTANTLAYDSSTEHLLQKDAKIHTKIYSKRAPVPTRNAKGEYVFPDYPQFRPNLSPSEVLQLGSFGGGYFRPIFSGTTRVNYGDEVWKELPQTWLQGLNIAKQVKSRNYDATINRYKVKCGGDLAMWEDSGWMRDSDPYGWFQWYCRFFQGRRCEDDDRQISRGMQCFGPTGRWRGNLCGKVLDSVAAKPSSRTIETETENYSISPVIRQTLQHWGYKLTPEHVRMYKKRKGR